MGSIQEQLVKHEGERLHPYRCTADKLTIGVGRNLEDKGISQEESRFLLENDIKECVEDLAGIFPDFNQYAQARQHALIDLRFNLGPKGFRSFKQLIAAAQEGSWEQAAAELQDSSWWGQVQSSRSRKLYWQLRTGKD
ncbi:MAG: glycoside hydrolase family protein [Desulfohalobiaceae bacterium]